MNKHRINLVILVVIAALYICINGCKMENKSAKTKILVDEEKDPFERHGSLAFLNNNCTDTIKTIDIESALTTPERNLGLMFRYNMLENRGMLFVMDNNEIQHFYMRNTYISLDIIYVTPEKRIVSIAKYTETRNDKSIPSEGSAIFVVEVNAGFCDTWNINPGDCIDFIIDSRPE